MIIDFERAVSLLKEKDDILILTHASPDGDTIGGGFALMLALQKTGKHVKLINNDEIPQMFSFIMRLDKKESFDEKFIISVDVADEKLLGKDVREKYEGRIDLSIDHHGTNRLYAKETYVEAESASVCEVIFLIIEALGVKIDSDIADCLFTGCSTDTGCFRYTNVTARTHKIAAKLIDLGARHGMINTAMFETKRFSFFKFQSMCLDTMELYLDGKVCVMVITRDMIKSTGCDDTDLDAIVPLSRQIEGVKVGITLKEKDNGIFKVSVRTTEEADASKICSAFGGGGHARAAGCSFECSAEKAKEQLLAAAEKFI